MEKENIEVLSWDKVWALFAETNRRLDKLFAETDRKIDKLCVQVGGINNNISFHAKQFF